MKVSIAFLLRIVQIDVLGRGPLAATAADADAVDNVALLGLVSQAASLIRAGRAAGAVDDLQLAKLLMHSQQSSTRYTKGDGGLEGFDSYLPALSQC
jgi:hypothetical protein